ncbi:hypothetical protein BN7_677 [Wickerhamomyces ciferrii]|uniref:Mitochondrial inner membrane i-AAA protease supercomplex subunit MGR3 n=1 Tax=Wickerhamomyces ciferrii (strain ATCC 14091 / BCRC 22168 / CBS 111 / JCM 3599 / NBRC 0793 / NRRL Y-1031 F-60-10) TaxID=1206466 RepID=K0K8G8_WICCF|nr:uncharacterized protein BN7_677 [Wickerhamomyces ciferrii]CCH41140.1 hypothetical protein BN7_677 [Wickerhamomyces ciferrii]
MFRSCRQLRGSAPILRQLCTSRIQTGPSLRFSSHYARQHASNYGRRSWSKIILTTLGGIGLIGLSAWWVYWPHHTFPKSVAKILRKGLWAESDKGEKDYQTALKHYLEALEEADKFELDPLSDEYTGIQLKVGEMYERLNMNQDALMVYSEIASAYLDALTTPGKIPIPRRPHIIQKDLRVVVKIVELNKGNPYASKMLLMTHFLIAQEEVAKRSKTVSKLIKEEKEQILQEVSQQQSPYSNPIKEDSLKVGEDEKIVVIEKNRDAWEPFRDELFNARDLYVAISLATGDLQSAVRTKIATTEWMLNADCDPGEILMSQANLGSLMYLQAEEFEAKEYRAIKQKLEESKIASERFNKKSCLDLALKCYESVLAFSKQLPAQLRREENVEESIALSTYGLGVIKLHLGELDTAKNLLRESRLRAKGSGFNDLVVEAERELEKLGKEVEKLEKENTQKEYEQERIKKLLENKGEQPDIELDIQLNKHK